MRDTLEAKRTRLETLLDKYEAERKASLGKGEAFKPPSKSKLLAEASLNKNYFVELQDKELRKRVDTLVKAKVKSDTEKKAEKIVAEKRIKDQINVSMAAELEAAQQTIERLKQELRAVERHNRNLEEAMQAMEQQGYTQPVQTSKADQISASGNVIEANFTQEKSDE